MQIEAYDRVCNNLIKNPRTWLVTGVAGFIGSNLLETLLKLNQRVVGLDNFATGFQCNLDEIRDLVSLEQWRNFNFILGDIRKLNDCQKAMSFSEEHPVDYVLHQAALGSVPRSIENPIDTNDTNISGFLNMLIAARDANVERFVYAASSSTYGDHPNLPKVEQVIGKPLSPYAITKYVNELYADVFDKAYGFKTVGLRYFNVFGRRQNPEGPYAAVIPKWISSLIKSQPIYINGDGTNSRDFCYVDNAVQMNLISAVNSICTNSSQVFNVAFGERTTLNDLFIIIKSMLSESNPHLSEVLPVYRDCRAGDIPHSLADISKAKSLLGYRPKFNVNSGLKESIGWYIKNAAQ